MCFKFHYGGVRCDSSESFGCACHLRLPSSCASEKFCAAHQSPNEPQSLKRFAALTFLRSSLLPGLLETLAQLGMTHGRPES
jgi:hypothetical protein